MSLARGGAVLACAALAGALVGSGYMIYQHVSRSAQIVELSAKASKLDRYCVAQRARLAGLLDDFMVPTRHDLAATLFAPESDLHLEPCMYDEQSGNRDLSEDPLFCSKLFRNDIPCMARITLEQLARWR
jgi:hypothetical protein